jgi:hypothetical protein
MSGTVLATSHMIGGQEISPLESGRDSVVDVVAEILNKQKVFECRMISQNIGLINFQMEISCALIKMENRYQNFKAMTLKRN